MHRLWFLCRFVAFVAVAAVALPAGAQTTPPSTAPPPAAAAPPATPPPVETSPLLSQAPAPAAPSPPAGDGSCFPACREGFVCSQARCVSLCNPPCPGDQVCVEGLRCEYGPPTQAGIAEPPPPPRIPFEGRSYSMIAFHYGFPSDVETRDGSGSHGHALGVNLRSDAAVAKYILAGPMLEFTSYEPGYYFDLDFYLRARVPIDAKAVQFQLWAGVPIGLTFDFLSGGFARSFDPELDGFALGWNVGVLFGGAVHFSRQFGIFTEFGWQQHKVGHDRAPNGSVLLVYKPWIWNVGFVFRG